MATADALLKPDHGGSRKHFIFTEEHDQLRESIRAFVTKELAPHAEEWEETTFPDSVFTRMGELGFLGLSYPEEYGGQGGDYYCNLVLGEEMTHSNSGGLAMGVAVHTDMATPPVFKFGTEEQKQEYLVPADPRREDLVPRDHRARRRQRRVRHQDARRARRRRLGHQRLEDLHHERAPRRLHRARDEDRPGRGLRRLQPVPRRHGLARRDPREEAREARDARVRHRAARLPGRARARGGAARPGGQGLLPHHVGAPGRAADRRRGLRGGRAEVLRQDAPVRHRAHRVRPPDRPLPGDPPQVRGHGDEDRGRPPDGLHDGLAVRERRVPGTRDLDGEALHRPDGVRGDRRVPPDPRRRGLHEGVRHRARLARHAPEPDRRGHRRGDAGRDRAVLRPL